MLAKVTSTNAYINTKFKDDFDYNKNGTLYSTKVANIDLISYNKVCTYINYN